MAGNNEAAEFSRKGERGSSGDMASCAVGQVNEALDYKWAFPSSQKDAEVESYGSCSKFLADAGEEQKRAMAKVGYSAPATEGVPGGYPQKNVNVVSEESYGSGRFLLSCSMASTRVKKKRRSRATSKAPIEVFSTDTSNFMAMVHKLTGIPSNAFPFYSAPLPSGSSKLSTFTQGLPTLDTSTVLLSCNGFSGGGAYSGLQTLPSQQLFSSLGSEMKSTNQSVQPVANSDTAPLSYSDLVRNVCNGRSTPNLPHLWEASQANHKSVLHRQQENGMSESEGIARHEGSQQAVTKESSSTIPTSKLSSLELLLGAHDKLASPTGTWVPSNGLLTSNMAKEELL